MVEVEGIDGGLRLQARAFEAPFDGALRAGLQFHIGEPLQGGGHAEIVRGGFSRVVSSWRLIVDRLSWFSFCWSGVIGFLSGIEDESVIFQQRQRIGGEFVEQRIAQASGGCGRRGDCCWRRMLAT